MLVHLQLRSVVGKVCAVLLAPAALLLVIQAAAQNQNHTKQRPTVYTHATVSPAASHGHPADTKAGTTPHGSDRGPKIAAAVGEMPAHSSGAPPTMMTHRNPTPPPGTTPAGTPGSDGNSPKRTPSPPSQSPPSQSPPSMGVLVPKRPPPAGTNPDGSKSDGNPAGAQPPSRTNPAGNGKGGTDSGGTGTAGGGYRSPPRALPPLLLPWIPYTPPRDTSREQWAKNGPSVPQQFDMSGFAVKGLVRPSWPIVLDFILDSPGAVQFDIIAADKSHYQAVMSNTPNRRAYAIVHLPANFGDKIQTAVYSIRAIPTPGTSGPTPRLRTYGLGAGDRAVGSVAIDQLTFGPAVVHPAAKELANYGFHAHSAFDGLRAEFIFTTLFNGRLLVEREQEEKLPPIPEGERARGTWEAKGKPGQHMLQIRAWRGLENGADWVVAWSPDIVDVVK